VAVGIVDRERLLKSLGKAVEADVEAIAERWVAAVPDAPETAALSRTSQITKPETLTCPQLNVMQNQRKSAFALRYLRSLSERG